MVDFKTRQLIYLSGVCDPLKPWGHNHLCQFFIIFFILSICKGLHTTVLLNLPMFGH